MLIYQVLVDVFGLNSASSGLVGRWSCCIQEWFSKSCYRSLVGKPHETEVECHQSPCFLWAKQAWRTQNLLLFMVGFDFSIMAPAFEKQIFLNESPEHFVKQVSAGFLVGRWTRANSGEVTCMLDVCLESVSPSLFKITTSPFDDNKKGPALETLGGQLEQNKMEMLQPPLFSRNR